MKEAGKRVDGRASIVSSQMLFFSLSTLGCWETSTLMSTAFLLHCTLQQAFVFLVFDKVTHDVFKAKSAPCSVLPHPNGYCLEPKGRTDKNHNLALLRLQKQVQTNCTALSWHHASWRKRVQRVSLKKIHLESCVFPAVTQ